MVSVNAVHAQQHAKEITAFADSMRGQLVPLDGSALLAVSNLMGLRHGRAIVAVCGP